MVSNDGFIKTICSICYEDLKPIAEDLQAISICGHVFHELCLQQWFEYSSRAKKASCPVCKQACTTNDVGRLYFQSVGDNNDSNLSPKRIGDNGEDRELIRAEIKRLEAKTSGLTSTLQHQEQQIKQLNDQLSLYKEKLAQEESLKKEAVKLKASVQKLLNSKSEDLEKLTAESLRMQHRNMALAKELAAIKLVCDLNLEEDDIFKLASFGNDGNLKDTVDVLRKSLVIRNRSYKELMAKCSVLGRGEARSSRKLEKATEKNNKLKARVQEMEAAFEEKDNEGLRVLNSSNTANHNRSVLSDGKENPKLSPANGVSSESQIERMYKPTNIVSQTGNLTEHPSFSLIKENLNSNKLVAAECKTDNKRDMPLDKEKHTFILIDDEDIADISRKHAVNEPGKHTGFNGSGINADIYSNSEKDDVCVLLGSDPTEVQPVLNITKESSSLPLPKPGDACFSGGLLGPDGTSRYLGKWCKRNQSNVAALGMSTKGNDLISIGADGRGGRVKVLRSRDQSLSDKESPPYAKRCKMGAVAGNLQSKGCLQIEHFFGKRATR